MSSEQNQARLSQVADYSRGNDQIYSSMLELSRINSGDQTAHIYNTHDFMVVERKWLSATQFDQIHNLCYNLPGPTTSQILITVVTLKLKSISTAINCFLIYNLIPWALLTILGLLSHAYLKEDQYGMHGKMVINGCTAAGAGIMVRSFFKHLLAEGRSIAKVVLILLTAGIFYHYRSQNSIIFCLTMGAVVSLYLQNEDMGPKKMSSKSTSLFSKLSFNFLLGKPSIIILLSMFFTLWIYFSIYPGNLFEYIFSFYWIGCMIIGPVEVIFAYFLSIMLNQPGVNITQMWIGVPISFFIPGSHLNIGIYFGQLLDGVRGAVFAAIFLYIPCFLFLLGMLPQWRYYRQKNGIKRIYSGLVCSTTGLTLSVIIMVLQHCMELDVGSSICIFIMCAVFNFFINRYAFVTIIIGGALGYARHLALNCYRLGTYCPFPFNL